MTKSDRLDTLMVHRQQTTVGFLRRAQVDGKFCESILDLFATEAGRRLAGRIIIESSPRIASSRNLLVRRFLLGATPWLLMVDDDMVFDGDLLERMHLVADEHDCPVLSGLYFLGGQENELRPAMVRVAKSLEDELLVPMPVLDYEPDEIIDVDGVGLGCLLVHRSVLEAVADKWEGRSAFPFFAETELNLDELGEDYTFCLRVRALGIPIRVDTGLSLGHSKRWVFTESDYRIEHVEKLGLSA